jgi:hypothetical protein
MAQGRFPDVPVDVLTSLLREHLGDEAATVISYSSAPLAHDGTNDSITLSRVTFSWSRSNRCAGAHTSTWIIKHWRAGGARDRALGIGQPPDVLAWEQGWLRPANIPSGLVVPVLGARRSPDSLETWLAMADVAPELARYTRMGLTGAEAVSKARVILAHLARFHAHWERLEHQAALQGSTWLRRPQQYLWEMAPEYARALGAAPADQPALDGAEPPADHGLAADLDAFLAGRPADERRLWEHLLVDRRALVEGLTSFPPTLLHGDLDDRNIGLRHLLAGMSELVLIDWEWITLGPAALDVADVVHRIPTVIRPGSPVPELIWRGDLADEYFACYRGAGGRLDATAWRRAYGFALAAKGITQMPRLHGRMRRAMHGEIPPPAIVGLSEASVRQVLRQGLPIMERMEQQIVREARRWLR